jgi:hypothetical protein
MHISGHVPNEVLLAFLDREVQAAEQTEIEGHVERCQACAVRLAGLRAATGHVGEALEALDVDLPWTDMPAELAEAARDAGATGVRAITTAPSVRRSRRFSGRAMAVAASLVLLLAAGAWAVPGSPLRAWLSRSAAAVSDLLRSDSPETEVTGAEDTADSGVSVQPLDGLVRISVQAAGPGTRVRVRLTNAEFASARSTEASVGYSVGPGLIEVVQPSGEMMIELPRRALDARVEIDGRVVVRKRGNELYLTPAADSSTAEILLETEG